jgi:hypothetical protein
LPHTVSFLPGLPFLFFPSGLKKPLNYKGFSLFRPLATLLLGCRAKRGKEGFSGEKRKIYGPGRDSLFLMRKGEKT